MKIALHIAVVAAAWTYGLVAASTSPTALPLVPAAEFGISGDTATLSLLREARQWLGPTERLGAVRALQIDGIQIRGEGDHNRSAFRYTLLFPDRFRSDLKTVTTVLDGPRYWRRFHQSVPSWQPTAEEDVEVRRRIQMTFVETCLIVLLRAPQDGSTVEARLAGQRTYRGIRGDAVEFAIKLADGAASSREFLFDVKTRQPLGFARKGSVGGEDTMVVEHFVRHEQVDGIRVPVLSETVSNVALAGQPAKDHTTRVERTIRMDPQVAATDFREPARHP